MEDTDEAVEQAQTVGTNGKVVVHDHDIVEERVDRRAQGSKGLDGTGVTALAGKAGLNLGGAMSTASSSADSLGPSKDLSTSQPRAASRRLLARV